MMRNCCTHCFNDRRIREFIARNGHINRCDFCKSEENSVVAAPTLSDLFESLVLLLDQDGDSDLGPGQALNKIFSIFNHEDIDIQEKLFEAVTGMRSEGTGYKVRYSDFDFDKIWNDFKLELTEVNRFFPSHELYNESELSTLASVIEQLTTEYPVGEIFYRARMNDEPLTSENMGAPPNNLSPAGRANPVGISYLYLGSDLDTVIAEVRPYNGATVYISDFTLTRTTSLINLDNPRKRTSPTIFSEEDFPAVIRLLSFLEFLSNELRKPVKPHRSDIEYLPTQFLCEFLKTKGNVDGIMFDSSFGTGQNYVLFDSLGFHISEPDRYRVTETRFSRVKIN